MIPYSKSELNCCRNLPSETYHPISLSNFSLKMFFFKIKMYLQVKLKKFSNIFSNLPSETYYTNFL